MIFYCCWQEVQCWDCTQCIHTEEEGYCGARSTVECCSDQWKCSPPQPRGWVDFLEAIAHLVSFSFVYLDRMKEYNTMFFFKWNSHGFCRHYWCASHLRSCVLGFYDLPELEAVIERLCSVWSQQSHTGHCTSLFFAWDRDFGHFDHPRVSWVDTIWCRFCSL